jgi:predicted enzyme related to lactoylglutathione lyase
MIDEFPAAVAEIPVTGMAAALAYYEEKLGFTVDWGRDGGGIAGISQGRCRLFLTDQEFRGYFGNPTHVVIWLNLDSKEEVDELHARWKRNGASILHPPESKSWSRLHEFVAADPDGNIIRAFYNF